jgi:fatty acid desaturase
VTKDNQHTQKGAALVEQRHTSRIRFLAVAYRAVLWIGLFLLVIILLLLLLTEWLSALWLRVPVALIFTGIFLAWVEYRLALKQHQFHE